MEIANKASKSTLVPIFKVKYKKKEGKLRNFLAPIFAECNFPPTVTCVQRSLKFGRSIEIAPFSRAFVYGLSLSFGQHSHSWILWSSFAVRCSAYQYFNSF